MSKLIGRCREAKEKLLFFYSCKSHKLSLLLCNSLVHWETRLLYKNVKFILQCKRTAFGVFFFSWIQLGEKRLCPYLPLASAASSQQ